MTMPARFLLVAHALGGGVEGHVKDMHALLSSAADIEILRPFGKHSVQLQTSNNETLNLQSDDWPALISGLKTRAYTRIFFHHIHGFKPEILDLAYDLKLPFDVTLHDYFAYCPQYQLSSSDGAGYCGEPDSEECASCLRARPHAWGFTIEEWRKKMHTFLSGADRVISPTAYVKARMARYFPDLEIIIRHHPPRIDWVLDPEPVIKVVVLGALSRIKGLETLIECAAYTKSKKIPLIFILLGFPEYSIDPSLPIHVRGEYDDKDLPALLAQERADLVWFPGKFPETHAYTLDVAIYSSLPILASARGAFIERLERHPHAQLLDAESPPSKWSEAMTELSISRPLNKETAAKRQMSFESRYKLRSEYLAFLNTPVPEVRPMHSASETADLSQLTVTLPCRDHMPLSALFEHGVLCGKREPKAVLGQRLKDIERDYAVLAGYSTRAEKPWYVLLEETENISNNAEHLREKVENLKSEAERVRASLQEHIAQLELGLHARSDALAQTEQEVMALKGQLAEITHRFAQTDQLYVERSNALLDARKDLVRAVEQIRKLENSTSWKVTAPLRFVGGSLKVILDKGGRFRNMLKFGYHRIPLMRDIIKNQGVSALVKRIHSRLYGQAFVPPVQTLVELRDISPLKLLTNNQKTKPKASLIIPVYGQHQHTYNCLKSIGEYTDLTSIEIIVVDDASPEPVVNALAAVEGIVVIRNKQNLGFIGSCHAGADIATGEYLVLLNNDIQVTEGWLDALLSVFDRRDDAGMVGARLVYPDGRLQEAGGIVWRDASAWNWGRNDDPEKPEYRYLRPTDYCSGACLALRKSDWTSWGGFDRHFAPAYYEDTDLAFKVRRHGKKVYYQPECKIIHFEGVSSGTDVTKGVKKHQVINLEKFYERWREVLQSHRVNGDSPLLEVDRDTKAHVLIVEACMITPDQDSGSVRMQAILELLVEIGCKVSFIADNLEYRQPYVQTMQQAGVQVWHYPYVKSVSQLLQEHGKSFDMIMFCRHYIASQYVPQVRDWAPQAKIVFDTVDLHYLREQRKADLEQSESMLAVASNTKHQELGVIRQVDLTLVVSPIEQEILAKDAPDANVGILSNIHEPRYSQTSYSLREGLLFIGGFRHPPNVDAVEWFVRQVWPLVREKLPTVTLTIVGSHMPESILSLDGNGIYARGYVNDVLPLIDGARISLAPLRYGAGVKGKINQAMACGLPVVATSVAAEGMSLVANEELLVADAPQDFANAVVKLYQDRDLWEKIAQNGYENVRVHFSRETARGALSKFLGL